MKRVGASSDIYLRVLPVGLLAQSHQYHGRSVHVAYQSYLLILYLLTYVGY